MLGFPSSRRHKNGVFCQFLDDLPPPNPAYITSLRISWEGASKKEHPIPEGDPHRILDVRAEFDRDAAQHQEPEDDDQGQVEPAEAGGIEHGESEEQSASGRDEPDLVSIPYRADGLQNQATLFIRFGREQVDGTSPQVKAVEHDIHGEHERNQDKP